MHPKTVLHVALALVALSITGHSHTSHAHAHTATSVVVLTIINSVHTHVRKAPVWKPVAVLKPAASAAVVARRALEVEVRIAEFQHSYVPVTR